MYLQLLFNLLQFTIKIFHQNYKNVRLKRWVKYFTRTYKNVRLKRWVTYFTRTYTNVRLKGEKDISPLSTRMLYSRVE